MSHVAKIKAEIKDLKALKNTCDRMGWQFKENQKSYKWYGRHIGDYPMPEGLTQNDLGKCDHAISVPNCNYEIGVVKNKLNGGKTYDLLWDFFDSSLKLAMGGDTAPKLVQAHTIEAGKIAARKKGLTFKEVIFEDKIRLAVNF